MRNEISENRVRIVKEIVEKNRNLSFKDIIYLAGFENVFNWQLKNYIVKIFGNNLELRKNIRISAFRGLSKNDIQRKYNYDYIFIDTYFPSDKEIFEFNVKRLNLRSEARLEAIETKIKLKKKWETELWYKNISKVVGVDNVLKRVSELDNTITSSLNELQNIIFKVYDYQSPINISDDQKTYCINTSIEHTLCSILDRYDYGTITELNQEIKQKLNLDYLLKLELQQLKLI